MITFLRGDFVYKTPALIHMDVQGVGYEVQISLHTFSQMQHLDKGVLHIYHQVKEDDEILFGFFETGRERDVYSADECLRSRGFYRPDDAFSHETGRTGQGDRSGSNKAAGKHQRDRKKIGRNGSCWNSAIK